ncbi:hypothetical protein EON65_24175 [archaeon]|nr:MAG: hypothetical protein EON65_24175 [archaeon]
MEDNSESNHGVAKYAPPIEIFTRSGLVLISLLDASDIIEVKKKANRLLWQKKHHDRYLAYASLSICEGNEIEIYKYYSATVPYFPADILALQEEFLFEPVNTNQSAVINIFCMHLSEQHDPFQGVEQRCVGKAVIPLSRLEENKPVCVCANVIVWKCEGKDFSMGRYTYPYTIHTDISYLHYFSQYDPSRPHLSYIRWCSGINLWTRVHKMVCELL